MLRRPALGLLFVALCTASLLLGTPRFGHAQNDQDEQEEIATPECNCGHRRPPAIAGTYTGAVRDPAHGDGTMTLVVRQRGKQIRGDVSISFPGEDEMRASFIGKISKLQLHAKFSPDKRCHFHITAAMFQGEFQGNFFNTGSCPEEESATFTVDLQ